MRTNIPRVYFEGSLSGGTEFTLWGDQSRHLSVVLRLKVGDKVRVFTGGNEEYLSEILSVERESVRLVAREGVPAPAWPWKIAVAQALLKSQKMDWVVEKTSELGASDIYPVMTEHVVKKNANSARWRRISLSAARQCVRPTVPVVHEAMSWISFLDEAGRYDLRLIASLSQAGGKLLHEYLPPQAPPESIVTAFGPEGDFTGDETHEALARGWNLVNLGPWVLRSETAAIAGISVLVHELMKNQTKI